MMDFLYAADKTVFFWIFDLSGHIRSFDVLMNVVTSDIFMPAVLFLTLMAVWFSGRNQQAREKNQRSVLCALIGMAIANVVVKLCNSAYDRPRPYEVFNIQPLYHPSADPSFPSNMAAVCFAVAMGIWMYNRKLGTLLLIPAIIVSFSRVYVGIHYPLDTIGGFFIAIVAAGVAFLVLRMIEPLPTKVINLMRKIYLA